MTLELVVKVAFELFFAKAYIQKTIAAGLGHLTNLDACNPKLDDVWKHTLGDHTSHKWILLIKAILALIECCTTSCESFSRSF